ncbi:MAG: sortase [Patescibacteria group bacterium]
MFLLRYRQAKRSARMRRLGFCCIAFGLLCAGIASAPLLLEAQWQAEGAVKQVREAAARLAGREERAVGRLPLNEDRGDAAIRARMDAFSLVGAAHAVAASEASPAAPENQESPVVAAALLKDMPQSASRKEIDRLKIPAIKVDMEIAGGGSAKVLNKGFAWLLPLTSTPDKGGNTVIGCHRYLFTSGSRTCFNLDKVKMGDAMVVDWKGIRYHYKVRDIRIVAPDEVSVLYATRTPVLTVFTCTPKFTSKFRLVVVADLIRTETL